MNYVDHEVRPSVSGAIVKVRFSEGPARYLYFAGARPHAEHPTQLLQRPKPGGGWTTVNPEPHIKSMNPR